MRVVRIILILLVLVGFPALSWVYLNSGLKWRVHAQEETATKSKLHDFVLMQPDSSILTPEDLSGKFLVVATPGDSESFANLEVVHTQFHVREDYQTIYLDSERDQATMPKDSTWIYAHCTKGCGTLQNALFGTEYSAAIVDNALHVRGRYRLSSVEDMRKLVEHLAVVLPIEKRERIELKRGNQ